MNFLRVIVATICMWRGVQRRLLVGGRDADDFRGARRQLQLDAVARAAEQDRRQGLAQLAQVLVAEHLALLVHDAVLVEEAEAGAQPAIVDELHDGIQLVQAVFQRRAGEHQGEARLQALDDGAGLRRPVLDALALVENDQVPFDPFDGQDVAQHLLVVADGEEAVVGVLAAALRRRRR